MQYFLKMNKQKYFDFQTESDFDINSFFVNHTNKDAYNLITNTNFNGNIILVGPKKSGKTHLSKIWQVNNNAFKYSNNLHKIISENQNVLIDDLFDKINEENLFHLINYCNEKKLKILATSSIDLFEYKFILPDLLSRLKTFSYVYIKNPDDEIMVNLLTKLLIEKQFIIKNKDIFSFLLKRINRTYEDVYNLVKQMDKISLEKKQQLTISSIKELI